MYTLSNDINYREYLFYGMLSESITHGGLFTIYGIRYLNYMTWTLATPLHTLEMQFIYTIKIIILENVHCMEYITRGMDIMV